MNDPNTLLKKVRFLVVDDMEAMRGLIKATLRNMGAENIDITFDGEAAWKVLNNKEYHIVISDWDMPNLTGLEFLKRVRASEEFKELPFLLLTASTEKSRVVEAISAGVTDYLSKPFQPKELEYRIIKLLSKVSFEQ